MARLYKKYVPSQTREYIESRESSEEPARPKSGKPARTTEPIQAGGGGVMGNSYSAEVWLDERRWDALEAALEEQGTNIESICRTTW